jgi:antitoxin CptB
MFHLAVIKGKILYSIHLCSELILQFKAQDLKKLAWHSRRGMLELDLILLPFVEQSLPRLDERQLGLYQELLAQEDQDLFVWFTRREVAPTEALCEIVEYILSAR